MDNQCINEQAFARLRQKLSAEFAVKEKPKKKRKKKQKRIAALDAETDPAKYGRLMYPFVWGLKYEDGSYYYFWGDNCTEQLIEFLQDEENLLIYAHNGGKFDFHFLLEYLSPKLKIINGRIAKCYLNDEKIELRDSMLILPVGLAANDKDVFDYRLMERDEREKNKDAILKYLKKDCESLLEWVMSFREEYGDKLTLAATAFEQLKTTSYRVEQTSGKYDERLRPYYFGGRVQCFETGVFTSEKDGHFDYVDINSAYSYAMLSEHWAGREIIEGFRLPENSGAFFAEIDAISRDCLPVRSAEDHNKLYFPDAEIVHRYKASGWEILAGLEAGTLDIKKVHRVFTPAYTADFSEYVDRFYQQKLLADIELKKAEKINDRALIKYWGNKRLFAKLLLNACYGKFAQDGRDFKDFMILPFGESPEGDGWTDYYTTENLMQIFDKKAPSDFFYNVGTAASITGFVRAYLYKHIVDCDRVLYCDTDSLICQGFKGELSDNLGAWEKEALFDECYIAARKMYACRGVSLTGRLKDKVASKGFSYTFDQIKVGVLEHSKIDYKSDFPVFSLKGGQKHTPKTTDFSNIENNALKNPPELYNKPVSNTGRIFGL